jgi:hypothetical protein
MQGLGSAEALFVPSRRNAPAIVMIGRPTRHSLQRVIQQGR